MASRRVENAYEAYKMAALSGKAWNSVIFWTYDHEAILCREVVNVNPYTTKKGSTKRSNIYLNKCAVPKFRVDKRSVETTWEFLFTSIRRNFKPRKKQLG
ncbi:hypothetical protein P5673_020840 [Acropora cervicornis]|uniref:Uncharacterized protein n=1 Tax=Acropora cervicornis TaxID=6130 RepID=A0AAD9Q937_ACRCE|nr:hypothetical protein P5673_020840 [Acropora cervicornis]